MACSLSIAEQTDGGDDGGDGGTEPSPTPPDEPTGPGCQASVAPADGDGDDGGIEPAPDADLEVTECRNISVHREENETYRIPYNIDAYRAEGIPENVELGLYIDGAFWATTDARIWDTGTNSYSAEFRGISGVSPGTHEVGLALATAVHEMPDAPQATCGSFDFLEHEACPPPIDFDSATVNQIVQGNHECPPSSIIEVVNFSSPGTITYDETAGELLKGITQEFFSLRLRNVSSQGIPVFDIPYIVNYEGIISGDPQNSRECINPYIGSTICEGPTVVRSSLRGRAVWGAGAEMGTPLEFQVPSGAPSMTVTIFPGTDLEQSATANVNSSGAQAIIPRPEGAPEPECTSNADCPDGSICFEGSCLQEGAGGGCQGNQDCPDGEECAGGTCVPSSEVPSPQPPPDDGGGEPSPTPTPTPTPGEDGFPWLLAGGLAAAGAGAYWLTQRRNGGGGGLLGNNGERGGR